eukprot:6201911-Pleurochrysis_carterae.AAC.2
MGRRRCPAEQNGRRRIGPQLTSRIKASNRVQDLLAMYACHAAGGDGIAVSATWTQLSKVSRSGQEAAQLSRLCALIPCTERMAAEGEHKSRGLANVSYMTA